MLHTEAASTHELTRTVACKPSQTQTFSDQNEFYLQLPFFCCLHSMSCFVLYFVDSWRFSTDIEADVVVV